MELDSFTENLIQRTQARRDYLNKKLSEINQLSARKRRTSNSNENSDSFEVGDANKVDDSPKRQCLETSSGTDSDTECVNDVENKENLEVETSQSNVFVPMHAPGKTRGLAALRKSNQHDGEVNAVCQSSKDEIMTGFEVPSRAVLTPKTNTSVNSRFAALAADIRKWDDDDSSNSSSVAFKTDSYPRESTSVSSNSSSSSTNSLCGSASNLVPVSENTVTNQHTYTTVKHVSFNLPSKSNNGDGQLVNSQNISNSCNNSDGGDGPQEELKQNLKSSKGEQQESQGFVKSSKSMLSYDFSPKNKQCSTEVKMPVVTESNQDKINGCAGNQRFVDPTGINRSPAKPVAVRNLEPKPCQKQISCQVAADASDTCPVDSDKDPAELPLSSRRALFEKAFFHGTQKQVDNACEASLSVAQRAALFEKAAKQSRLPPVNKIEQRVPISPVKIVTGSSLPPKTGVKVETNSAKELTKPCFSVQSRLTQSSSKSGSPLKTLSSPAKTQNFTSNLTNTESHTLSPHKRPVSHADFQEVETVKAKEERNNNISALRSHWEKVSSSSADSNPESEMPEDNSTDGSYSSDSISSESEYSEQMVSEKNEIDEYGECADITGEAVAVCDEMDELLNEALDPQTKSSAPLSSPEWVTEKCQVSDKYSSQSNSQDQFSSTPKSLSSVPVCSSDGSTKMPLLQYTVSTYRKQKQEAKMTPVRVIKREPSIDLPSPKADNPINIKEEIQVLQNEILTQQNHISQTSQALNLCCATAEFCSSTEEVEGERLLLIATLKRQACLNEIQRLKTLRDEMPEDRKGTLIISDIRLPLKREFIACQVEGNSDMVHYFLCSIRHRAQVVFTQMLSSKDGDSAGCLNFTNHINIHNLSADFSVAFEVYSLQRKKEVLPHEKKYHIKRDHSKLRLTPKGKKGDARLLTPAVSSPGGPCAVRTPSFSIVGYTRFTINNCDRKRCTMEKVPFTSPLEGTLHFNLQLHAEHNISMKGFLTMFEDVSGFGAWHRRWCVLDGGDLAFWKYPDEEKKKEPIGIIDLTQCVTSEVGLVSRDICARPHTFQLTTVRPHEKGDKNTLISRSMNTLTTTKHLLSADTKPERIMWSQKLNSALTNVRKWNPHALRPVEMKKDSK